MTLAKKLQKLREKRGLTQQQVSILIHVTRCCYANYEAGRRTPPYSVLLLLADIYHVSVDMLIREDTIL